MGVTTFDTLKFVRRLEAAGVPSQQAEVQAEVLTEVFNVNLEELVTKDYLVAAQFAEQNARVDNRFAEQSAAIDKRFAEQKTNFEKRFADQDANFKLMHWILRVVTVVTVIPFLQSPASFLT